MVGVEVTPYSKLPADQIPEDANWVVSGSGSDWTEIRDKRFGVVQHIKVTNPDGSSYDKLNLALVPGAFVVVFRVNPEKNNQVEYFLPYENRPVLRDPTSPTGEQGNVWIRNIPQGIIKVWKDEAPEDAARREVQEETGLTPKNVVFMRELYMDAASSETPHPFFLAEVDFQDRNYTQTLDSGEQIKASEEDWFTFEEFEKMKLQCVKTIAGIYLSTGFLGTWNESTDPAQTESMESSDNNLTLGLL